MKIGTSAKAENSSPGHTNLLEMYLISRELRSMLGNKVLKINRGQSVIVHGTKC